jgi:hypothetical protein
MFGHSDRGGNGNQKPQSKPTFRDKARHETRISYYFVTWEEEKLEKPYQNAKKINDQQDAQNSGQKARLENQITKRKKPGAKK